MTVLQNRECFSLIFSVFQMPDCLSVLLMLQASLSLSRVWLCNPMGSSPPGSSVYRISQARILVGWHFLLQGIFPIRDWTCVSCVSSIAGGFFTCWDFREAQWFFLNIRLPSHTGQCHIHLWHFWQLIILLRNLHWWDALYSLFLLSQASLQHNLPYIEAALAGCLAPKGPSTKSCANSYPAAAAAKSLQSCPTLCDPIDGTPPGSPVPGILQARTLE